jgi:hypothetical protein
MRNEVNEFLVAQEVGADLGNPVHLCASGDDISQQRFRPLDVDREVASMKKTTI